jgi:hypothetical protein
MNEPAGPATNTAAEESAAPDRRQPHPAIALLALVGLDLTQRWAARRG